MLSFVNSPDGNTSSSFLEKDGDGLSAAYDF